MIGILGGTGDIGQKALKAIKKKTDIQVKCSGRNLNKVDPEIKKQYPDVLWEKVDIENAEEIESFSKNCNTILNCVGPSSKVSEKIAEICLNTGCHYVDVGFCDAFYDRKVKEGEQLVFAAGTTPGFVSLLMRYMAGNFEHVTYMKYIIGAIEEFSYAGAWDYIQGIADESNVPLSSYKNGNVVPMSCMREDGVKLPFFDDPVNLRPYTDRESMLVQKHVQADKAQFYLALDGDYLEKAMNRLRVLWDQDKDGAVKSIQKACKLETLEKEPYLKILIEMHGMNGGKEEIKTLYLYTRHSSVLTATTGAMTAVYVHEGKLEKGVYPCVDMKDVKDFIKDVLDTLHDKEFEIYDSSIEELLNEEEGEI